MEFNNIPVPMEPEEQELVDLRSHFQQHADILKEEFSSFYRKSKQILALADSELSKNIDTDPVLIEDALISHMSIYYSVGQCVADAKTYLQIYSILHYSPKKQKYSEADRKLYTNTKSLIPNNLVLKLSNAEEKMEKKITVLQSILKAETSRGQKENIG